MKYLKKFMLFESRYLSNYLEDIFSEEEIEDYFEENYFNDMDEVISYSNFWNFVDDDEFVKDWIKGETDYYAGDEWKYTFDDDSTKNNFLIPYIEKNINDDIIDMIKDLYVTSKLGLDYENDKEKIEDIDEYYWGEYLSELEASDVRTIIEDHLDTEDVAVNYLEDRFEGSDAKTILSDFTDTSDHYKVLKDYPFITNYIDEEALKNAIIDETDLSYKSEYFSGSLRGDEKKLKKIFKENPYISDLIYDYLTSTMALPTKYKFQKHLIDAWKKHENKKRFKDKLRSFREEFEVHPKILNDEKYGYYFAQLDAERFGL